MELIKYIASLTGHLKKDDVQEDSLARIKEFETLIVPSYSEAADFFNNKKFSSSKLQNLSVIFYRFYIGDVKFKNNFILEIADKLPDVVANLNSNAEMINGDLEADTLKDGISAKKALLVRNSDLSAFISKYCIDLLSYVYLEEIKESSNITNAADFTKQQLDFITDNISQFAKVFGIFSMSNKDFVKKFDDVPDVLANEESVQSIVNVFGRGRVDPLDDGMIVGFVPNPFYHAGIVWAEWENYRYKRMVEARTSLNLKLLYLRQLKDQGVKDASIEKQIAYNQDRVEDLDYKIQRIEESVK